MSLITSTGRHSILAEVIALITVATICRLSGLTSAVDLVAVS